METLDFLHRLSKFSEQLKMECAFQDSTELLNLGSLKRIEDQNPHEFKQSSLDNSEMPHTKMKQCQLQLKQAMASFLYHVVTARRRFPWP